MRFVEVGLLIFLSSFVLCVLPYYCIEFMIIGEPWRLGVILEANPHFYLGYIQNVLLYSILPLAVGAAFIIIGYIIERKTFLRWHIAIAGGIIFFWGVYALQRVHEAYVDIMKFVTRYTVPIDNLVLLLYVAVGVAKILWIFAGVLSMHPYLFNVLRNEWRKYTETSI